MAKKLILRKQAAPKIVETKRIDYETTNGNKGVLKATVISVNNNTLKKQQSNAIIDDPDNMIGYSSGIIRPPLSQQELSILQEYSSELGPNIDAMVIGVEGFGQRVVQRTMTDSFKKTNEVEIIGESSWIQSNLLDWPNSDGSLRKLRKLLCEDREQTGNAYCELVPSLTGGKYTAYNRIEPSTMFITKTDKSFTRINIKYVDNNFQLKTKTFLKRMRRFVQVVGNQKAFFKEFRDPRPMDSRTGELLRVRNLNGIMKTVDKDGKEVPQKYLAREVFHFKIATTRRTPYGLPRYVGNIIAIKGSRSADEANILTMQNNNVPSMAVLVSGGMLTEGSVGRLQDFVDQSIKGDMNYSKFLILEGEGTSDSLSGSSSMKVEIKPLTNDQHTDALWSEYDKANATKIRRAFRQPPILVGNTENLDRATAAESERLAEKYIYNPEREDLDEDWNSILVHQGIKYHVIETNSPNVTNAEDIVKILSGAEKTGGVTPRIAHEMLEEILNRKLPKIIENDPDFNPDLPFSISVGKLARGMARSNGQGTLATTGQQEADRTQEDLNLKVLEQISGNSFLDMLHKSLLEVFEIEQMGETVTQTRKKLVHKHAH